MVSIPLARQPRRRKLLAWRPPLPIRVLIAVSLFMAALWAVFKSTGEVAFWPFAALAGLGIGLSVIWALRLSRRVQTMTRALQQVAQMRTAVEAPEPDINDPDLTQRRDELGALFSAMGDVVRVQNARITTSREFAADLVHEVRNPLASLHAAAEMLEQPDSEEMRAELSQMVAADIHRIDRLVGQISEAAKLERALDEECAQPFDLVALFGRIRVDIAASLLPKGIELVTDFPSEPIWITGLEARIAQVIMQLVDNAKSFCVEGDAVRIWLRHREDRVHVVVEDTGPGIPEVALTRIFRRFYAHRPAHHEGPHTGLGLAVAQQIAEAHGGALWAENIRPTSMDIGSEPLGARFVLGLPA